MSEVILICVLSRACTNLSRVQWWSCTLHSSDFLLCYHHVQCRHTEDPRINQRIVKCMPFTFLLGSFSFLFQRGTKPNLCVTWPLDFPFFGPAEQSVSPAPTLPTAQNGRLHQSPLQEPRYLHHCWQWHFNHHYASLNCANISYDVLTSEHVPCMANRNTWSWTISFYLRMRTMFFLYCINNQSTFLIPNIQSNNINFVVF